MRYRTQAVAYPYFVVALLLFGLQMVFGLLAAAKYLGPDPDQAWLPFDVAKEIHTNLLIVWVLTGFMGAATGSCPRSRGPSFYSPQLAYAAARALDCRWRRPRWSATCSAGPPGNKLLEQPLPLKIAIVDRDADVPLQHRHDDLEGEPPHDHRRRAGGRPGARRRCCTCRRCSSSTTTRSRSSTAGGRCISGSRACGR